MFISFEVNKNHYPLFIFTNLLLRFLFSGFCAKARSSQDLGHQLFKVLDLAFDSVGARLAAAEGNGHVQVWDVRKNSELLFCLSGHTCEVSKVCFSPGGGQLLTASSDGTARLWSARDGRALQLLDGHTDEVFSCAFSYTGESILTASKDKTCRLWKMKPIIDDGY